MLTCSTVLEKQMSNPEKFLSVNRNIDKFQMTLKRKSNSANPHEVDAPYTKESITSGILFAALLLHRAPSNKSIKTYTTHLVYSNSPNPKFKEISLSFRNYEWSLIFLHALKQSQTISQQPIKQLPEHGLHLYLQQIYLKKKKS